MNFWKFLLFLLILGVGVYAMFWVFGILATLLWYVVIFGIIGIGGYAGYKLFLSGGEKETPQLEEKKPVGIAEIQNLDRALEEYKRKSLKE
ncbi:MAG: hypothetical protein ABIP06_03235 [Pyrinomonadaceae bacterium]